MKNLLIICVLLCIHFTTNGQQRTYKQHGIRSVETQITNPRKPERSFLLKQTYDKKGKLLEEIKTESSGKVIEHLVFTYKKNTKTTIKKDSAGNVILMETSTRNKDGKVIETFSENFLKHTKEGRKYIYDKWGKLTSEVWLNNINQVERTKNYYYNSEGLLIKQISLDETNTVIFQKDIRYEN